MNLLRLSSIYGLETVLSIYQSIVGLLPLPNMGTDLELPKREDGILGNMSKAILPVIGATYLLAVCLPIDTASSVISFITRTLASITSALTDGMDIFSSDDDPTHGTAYKL